MRKCTGRLAMGAAVLGGTWVALRPRTLRWGATDDEATRVLPGDELVTDAQYVTTRSLTIHAPAEAVFPWLVQLGQNRGGFYTYDALENLFCLNIYSADSIHAEWQELQPGVDYVSLDPQQTMKMTIVQLQAPQTMVLRTGAPGEAPQEPGDFFKQEIAGTWAFIVRPLDATTSRLIVRLRVGWRPTAAARLAAWTLLEPAHFIMERGMMLGIKKRAEAGV